jgi:polysaccharide pyruvyl transferase WcaK-like protein
MSLRIGVYGMFGIDNIGNDATLAAFLEGLEEYLPDATVVVVSPNPSRTTHEVGVPAIPVGESQRTGPSATRASVQILLAGWAYGTAAWSGARHFDALVICGTGVLESTTPKTALRLLAWTGASSLRRRPVLWLNVGVDSISNPRARSIARTCARLTTYKSLRDPLSLRSAERQGLPVENSRVFPDLVYARKTDGSPPQRHGPRQVVISPVSSGRYGWATSDTDRRDTLERNTSILAQFANHLLTRDLTVKVVSANPRDDPAVESLLGAIKRTDEGSAGSLLVDRVLTMEGLLQSLSGSHAIVASRYHTLIAAHLLATPVISLGYSAKFEEAQRMFGLGGFSQPLEQLELTPLLEQFAELDSNRDALAERMVRALDHVRDQVSRGWVSASNALRDLSSNQAEH